nr:hypothetical protein BAR15_180082 [Bartonella sp. AR 15-3]
MTKKGLPVINLEFSLAHYVEKFQCFLQREIFFTTKVRNIFVVSYISRA